MVYNKVAIGNILSKTHSVYYQMHRMGSPIFTEAIDTAAVGYDKTGKFTNYYWNPTFFAKLSDEEIAAVVIHESLHILLNHGFRGKDLPYPKLQNKVKDCVINRIISEDYGYPEDIFDKIVQKISPDSKACTFNNIFPEDEYPNLDKSHSWEYYYELALENAEELEVYLSFDENNCDIDISEIIDIDWKDFGKNICSNDKNEAYKAGHGEGTEEIKVNAKKKECLAWIKAIKKWRDDFDTDDVSQWIKPNRRMQNLPDGIFLPSMDQWEEPKRKPDVWVFLDVSYSCKGNSDEFFEAALSIPQKKFNVKYFVFDDGVRTFNINDKLCAGLGGTNFVPIEEEALKAKYYPQHIWVITDGDALTVNPKHPDRWSFFIGGDYATTQYLPKGSKIYQLKDFT